jgi:hypothetical protein
VLFLSEKNAATHSLLAAKAENALIFRLKKGDLLIFITYLLTYLITYGAEPF